VGGMHSCGQDAHWTGDRHLALVGMRSCGRLDQSPGRCTVASWGAHTAVVTSLVCGSLARQAVPAGAGRGRGRSPPATSGVSKSRRLMRGLHLRATPTSQSRSAYRPAQRSSLTPSTCAVHRALAAVVAASTWKGSRRSVPTRCSCPSRRRLPGQQHQLSPHSPKRGPTASPYCCVAPSLPRRPTRHGLAPRRRVPATSSVAQLDSSGMGAVSR
jgi:hypothetical protein